MIFGWAVLSREGQEISLKTFQISTDKVFFRHVWSLNSKVIRNMFRSLTLETGIMKNLISNVEQIAKNSFLKEEFRDKLSVR